MHATENRMNAMTSLPIANNPFQCATLLDEQGHEIPITEEMIAQACDELMKQCRFPKQAS